MQSRQFELGHSLSVSPPSQYTVLQLASVPYELLRAFLNHRCTHKKSLFCVNVHSVGSLQPAWACYFVACLGLLFVMYSELMLLPYIPDVYYWLGISSTTFHL
jgi:hypothetical protein